MVILLDYDGTICHSAPAIIYSWQNAFIKYGIAPPSTEQIMDNLRKGLTLENTINILHPHAADLSDENRKEFAETYRSIYLESGENFSLLFDGVIETLSLLKNKGHKICVVSNKTTNSILNSLNRFELNAYFDLILGTTNKEINFTYLPKPHRDIFDKIIRPQFPTETDFIMIGDTPADIAFGKNCEIRTCWAAFGYGDREKIMDLKPDFVANNFSEIATY
jgi:phosphoglycolate phosphatase